MLIRLPRQQQLSDENLARAKLMRTQQNCRVRFAFGGRVSTGDLQMEFEGLTG